MAETTKQLLERSFAYWDTPEGAESITPQMREVSRYQLDLLNQYGANNWQELPPDVRLLFTGEKKSRHSGINQALSLATLAASGQIIGTGMAGAAAANAGGTAAGVGAGSMEMAPAWTAAETASAGGMSAVAPPLATQTAGGFTAEQAAAMPISELGMVANPTTAATAVAGGIPEAMVGAGSGGLGAIGLNAAGGLTNVPPSGTPPPAAAAPLAQQVAQDGSNGPGMDATDASGNVVPPLNGSGQGAYQFPYQDIFQGLFGAWTGQQQADSSMALLDKLIASDQWRTQAPRYYEPLNDALTKGLGNTAYGNAISDQTMRKASSLGYNMSGNMLQDLNKGLNASTLDYAKVLSPLALGRGETSAGTPALTNQIVNGENMRNRAYGGMLENLFTGSGNNNQPSLT